MSRSRRFAAHRNELIALAVLAAILFLLPKRPPPGIYLIGIASGGALALHALAIVLVYRTNRFLNLAQIQLAAFASTLFAGLVNGRPMLRIFNPDTTPGVLASNINFVIAILLTFAVVVGGTALIYQTLIRRFANSPRVIPTLVTIFLGQALLSMNRTVLGWLQPLPSEENLGQGIPNGPAAGPVDFTMQVGPIPLQSDDVLAIILVPVVALAIALYLRRSAAGVAIRASGENPDRARTLGLDVFGVTTRVWMLVGGLAALAGILEAFASGAPIGEGLQAAGGQGSDVGILPVGQLVMILAVAVVARFTSLPMAVAAGFVLATLRTAVQWSFGSTAPFEAALVLLVGGLLLLQRERQTRARREEASLHEVAREPHPVPGELRQLGVVRQWIQAGVALLAIVLLGLPWILNAGQTSLAGTFLIGSVVGLSLLILTGWAGQISLGQWGFAGIGAWVLAVTGLPLPVGLLLAGIVGAVASIVVGFPALKLRGLQLAIATLAFAWSANFLFFDDRYLGGHLPISLENRTFLTIDLGNVRVGYYAALVFSVLFVMATIGLRRSRFGRALIAVRSNEEGAEAFGIDPKWLRLIAFAVAGSYAAMAGAMFAAHQGVAQPEAFVADESVRMFMFTVIGGLGGVAGPLLGFAFLGTLSFLSANPLVSYLGAGVGGLLLLTVAPGGLAEVFYRMRDAALRRLAIRNRIAAASLLGDRAAKRLQEHALLREYASGQQPALPPLRYELVGQWALERFGLEGATRERVGVAGEEGTNGKATGNGDKQ